MCFRLNLSFYSAVYPCHSVRFILWTMIWHGIRRHASDLFMKHKLKTSKNLINYKASLFFLFFPPFSLSPQSISKNMKSELEISPDNEVLDSLSKETPQTPSLARRNWRVFNESGQGMEENATLKLRLLSPLLEEVLIHFYGECN